MKKIIMIAAAGEDNSLGKDNDLLWHLPDDFKRFKRLTSGHKIIMGRKTFESFPKPLPNRTHIIITRDENYTTNYDHCIVVHSIEDALNLISNEEAYIIGGGEIYKQGEEYSDFIELTRVHGQFEADTYFPEIDEDIWEVIEKEYHPKDEKHKFDFTYVTYERRP
ncbi:dihydrofolate reductase [Maribacter sp. PR1]|uniref:Dihydrofolate reductase n=1 Tax=Maribacter cobaltidurans TaxID=1178778 RepID=A0ABU7IYN5_9FLAO|nr:MULTISPECIES: dihydrofolate reductase [Maribacter]MDC6390689.1 dihydrofolate reductase [Maribacter sp. PR1]MEE1978081.1 dihydrofolate reductase [Maribacter cobaltidurans]